MTFEITAINNIVAVSIALTAMSLFSGLRFGRLAWEVLRLVVSTSYSKLSSRLFTNSNGNIVYLIVL